MMEIHGFTASYRWGAAVRRVLLLGALAALASAAPACTRVLYVGQDGVTIAGRNMDWSEDQRTNLWAFPAGIPRDGAAGARSLHWVSRYGSLVAATYDAMVGDGMNEKGLSAQALWLTESDYGAPRASRPNLSLSLWTQYVLDNFATVSEAVAALEKEPFTLIRPAMPGGRPANVHLSISDASGDSAIFEYLGGRLTIHHGRQYTVMTNSPTYDQQLAINEYWKLVGGLQFLPGTISAADRFVRASFFLNAIPRQLDERYASALPEKSYSQQAVASVLGVMRAVSTPLGIAIPGQPNLSATIWRTAADQGHRVYFFDSATRPNTFWVALDKLDLKPGAPVQKLSLDKGEVYAGEVSGSFQKATPFAFAPAKE